MKAFVIQAPGQDWQYPTETVVSDTPQNALNAYLKSVGAVPQGTVLLVTAQVAYIIQATTVTATGTTWTVLNNIN